MDASHVQDLAQRLSETEATLEALLSGQIDAVFDPKSKTPLLLSKAQEALRESEERYRRIVETTNDGILTIDTGTKITFVNRRTTEMLGRSADEMLGKSLSEIMPEVTLPGTAFQVEPSRVGLAEEGEVAVVRKDGSALWALLKTNPIRGAEGRYLGTLVLVTDRTRHKQAEDALKKTEAQYREIVEATSDGILKLDDDARIVFVNRRFAEMLGQEPHEMVGMTVFAFMSDAAKVVAAPALHGRQQVKDAVDTTFRHRDGRDISVNLAATLLLDEKGHYVGHLAVVRDVTERKKLQSELMVSDRMASVGTLAAGVAHEINNPLAAVIANLDYMTECLAHRGVYDSAPVPAGKRGAWLPDEIAGSLGDAREAAQRVRFIVRDLKIFSRSPSEESTGSVDVNAIMESSLRMAWNEIRHRARLVKSLGPVPGVEANEARLGQVFLNLIVNAAQAIVEGRAEHNQICVVTRVDGDDVVVEVSDTGSGIPPEILARVFDAFFTTKKVGFGTGLGLAICQRIVTNLGGALTVRSEVGKGTTFRVALPVSRKESEPKVRAAQVLTSVRRGRILIVDDEILIVRVLKRILSKKHDVEALSSAKEALAMCSAGRKFDLILCDLMMPDMTGMEFHRELSLVDPEQVNKMIFLTGGTFTDSARQFLSGSPKEYLEKPFDAPNILAIVQRYLR